MINLSFKECMSFPPVENPLSECFECRGGMCEICKKSQYYHNRGEFDFDKNFMEEFINKYRYTILKEILEEIKTNDILDNIH